MLRCVMEIWWILKPWQCAYNANLWSTYKWLVHSLKRMWLVMSIVNARPFYKRMGPDVIKSLWVGYMSQLTSMEGLRKNDTCHFSSLREIWEEINFIWQKWLIVLYVLYVTMVCLLWTTERAKERNSSCL